jgi:hypothetical protein
VAGFGRVKAAAELQRARRIAFRAKFIVWFALVFWRHERYTCFAKKVHLIFGCSKMN